MTTSEAGKFNWFLKRHNTTEFKNIEMKVLNIFMTKNYDIADAEKVHIMKKGLVREGLHFIQTLTADV